MEKLKMHSVNNVEENINKIAELFPNTITEVIKGYRKDGSAIIEHAIDFDVLRQELSDIVIEGQEERYQFTWPDKKKSILLANAPIAKTLRPSREDSVNFDSTENIYIEGDNLDVLKLLQETYLGEVKMIYIDPPYNTGTNFIYEDDFTQTKDQYLTESGQFDLEGNRLYQNLESNGRFHTDWLNMIYPRLKLAKDLLTEDGVIFISIDDHEVDSMKKICSEIYGAQNFIATLIWDKNHSAQAGIYKAYHEYVLVFCKNINALGTPKSLDNNLFEAGAMKKPSGRHSMQEFKFPKGTRFDAPHGFELKGEWGGLEKVILVEGRMISENGFLKEDVTLRAAFTQANQMKQYFYGDKESLIDSRGQKIVEFYFSSTGKIKVIKERGVETPQTTLKFGAQGPVSKELANLFGLEDSPFDSPKPVNMIYDFVARFTDPGDIILDFFSGSATTAHAILKLNAENVNNQRKYILVQIPENLDESLKKASKDGRKTLETAISFLDKNNKPRLITEIGKERIRRASKKILEEIPEAKGKLDIGFRVLKVDSTNMEDVYYNPADYSQDLILKLEDNIKPDRSPEDLLFQVMLDLGILLSSKIEKFIIEDKQVFNIADGYLIACFDNNINSEVITEIAKKQPYYAVFRDSSLANDSVVTNFEQIFETYSPTTVRKVL
ncbi:site-specific DNA-methyltransferase [Ureibacillus sp. 179-F W5.1 NHS]|uniref:site-specific DNA-methyltransferase n=1 Tax=Ureibacillus sp. 179-F W5.1 NHS TaxID=3374297 RepID=UPI0038798AAA